MVSAVCSWMGDRLLDFVGDPANATFGGSGGIRSTSRPELPYPCCSQAKSRDKTSRRGSHGYK